MNETGIWTGILNSKIGKFKFIYVEIIETFSNLQQNCSSSKSSLSIKSINRININKTKTLYKSKSHSYLLFLIKQQQNETSSIKNHHKSTPELALSSLISLYSLNDSNSNISSQKSYFIGVRNNKKLKKSLIYFLSRETKFILRAVNLYFLFFLFLCLT